MPNYKYIAKSEKRDEKIEGKINISSKSELAKDLRKKGFFLIEAEEVDQKRKNITALSFSKKISLLERIMFTRNLRAMLSGGLSFSRSLQVLSEQTRNKRFKEIILDIRDEVNKGNTFAQSLEKHPGVFPEILCNMIRLAEEAGTLEETLETLTEQLESEYKLKSSVKGALIYPSIVVFAMLGIGVIFLTILVPQLAATFEGMGADLPIFTRIIIVVGNFLSEKWYIMLFFVIALIYFLRFLSKNKKGKKMIDGFLLKFPIISTIVRKSNAAYVVKTMASLLISGVPMMKSMKILSRSVSNIYFAESITDAIKIVEKGGKLSKAFLPYTSLYGSMVIQMLEVGEETGKTTDMLLRTAEFLEEEVVNLTKNLATTLEPILMILIGTAIGIFAFAVIMPIYSMLDYI